MKRSYLLVIISSVLMLVIGIASAMIQSDPVFESATTNLKSNKQVTFSAVTSSEQNYIKVTKVELYKQNSNSSWSYVCNLPVPAHISMHNTLYGATKDYSDYIGAGTYRIYTTFCADGHNISRYSNVKTFQ